MTSYFEHNAHKTRPDKTKSATSWDVIEMLSADKPEISYSKRSWDFIKQLQQVKHTYGGKKAGER